MKRRLIIDSLKKYTDVNLLDSEILVLTYDDIWKLTYKLAKEITESNLTPDILVGIARGGLVVTRLLSDIMDIYPVAIFGVGFYKGINDTEKEPKITQDLQIDLTNKQALLIDDVSDSGKSFTFAVKYLQEKGVKSFHTVALHYKPHSIFKPDIYVSETSKWIVYPWEYMEFSRLYFKQQLENGISKNQIKQKLLAIKIPNTIVEEIMESKK